MVYKDYYKTLGVPRNATQEEIRKAFRGLARQYHPDIAGNNPQAEERFKEVNEAYEVLSDARRRRRYNRIDRSAAEWESAESWEFRGTGFSEFFHDFFAGRRSRSRDREDPPPMRDEPETDPDPSSPPPKPKPAEKTGETTSQPEPQQGENLHSELLITLNQALRGTKKTITVKRPARGANGQPPESEVINFTVPAGIREGQAIRLAGKGRLGKNGGPPGDLLLQVIYARHPDFDVEGADLHCLLKIAPWDAVLGGEALLPTLEKPVPIKIKAGTQGGRSLRIRNLGLLKPGGARGDIIAEIQIVIPTVTGPQEMRYWKKLKQVTRWNPAQGG